MSVKSTIKDLGIIFDTKLSFTDHIISVFKAAFSIIGFIRVSTNYLRNSKAIRIFQILEPSSVIAVQNQINRPRHNSPPSPAHHTTPELSTVIAWN